MIKRIIVLAIVLTIAVLINYTEHHYTREVTVVEVDCQEVTVEDNQGNLWTFFGDGYTQGQAITVVMYDNTTDSRIVDDEIVRVKS